MKMLPMPTRRRIYREVKALIEARPLGSHVTCLTLADHYCYCSLMHNVDTNSITTRDVYDLFPEFAEQKPKRKLIGDLWWPLGYHGNKSRIKALQRAIDLCNKK